MPLRFAIWGWVYRYGRASLRRLHLKFRLYHGQMALLFVKLVKQKQSWAPFAVRGGLIQASHSLISA
ncbi:MAG: hypothetical protein KME29_18135 [Calothrix sp. FI2-JRJ7]|nr:hypothetical protein [Calothrix sp. FI2-JRJ7]